MDRTSGEGYDIETLLNGILSSEKRLTACRVPLAQWCSAVQPYATAVNATSPHQKRHFGHHHYGVKIIENTSNADGHLSDMLATSSNHFYTIKPPR